MVTSHIYLHTIYVVVFIFFLENNENKEAANQVAILDGVTEIVRPVIRALFVGQTVIF